MLVTSRCAEQESHPILRSEMSLDPAWTYADGCTVLYCTVVVAGFVLAVVLFRRSELVGGHE